MIFKQPLFVTTKNVLSNSIVHFQNSFTMLVHDEIWTLLKHLINFFKATSISLRTVHIHWIITRSFLSRNRVIHDFRDQRKWSINVYQNFECWFNIVLNNWKRDFQVCVAFRNGYEMIMTSLYVFDELNSVWSCIICYWIWMMTFGNIGLSQKI